VCLVQFIGRVDGGRLYPVGFVPHRYSPFTATRPEGATV
jgi:hypothetical protein